MYGYTDMSEAFRIRTLYTAFTEEIGSDYQFAGERHNFWELVVVLRGQVGVTAGEETGVLSRGQAVLHSPMEFHRVWYAGSDSGQIMVLSFSAEGMPKTARYYRLPDPDAPLALLEAISSAYILDNINVVGVREPQVAGQIVLKRLELFILALLSESHPAVTEVRSRSAENYARIVRYMENNVHRNLSVDEIARQCSMSPINAKQTFSRYAGMGIRNYFNRLKVEAAVNMLRSGSSVQETASALGFSSQNYFSTVFKRIMGKPPTGYK